MLMEADRHIKKGCGVNNEKTPKNEEIDDYPPKPEPLLPNIKISKDKCIKMLSFQRFIEKL